VRSRLSLALAVLVVGLASPALPAAHAEGGGSWRLEAAEAPPAPAGVSPAPYSVPVGEVGEISFWAPNRGLLITGGAGPVGAGLYAYDGVSWHQLATVCGGGSGRIAWAGPDEFWTISDQRAGQVRPRNSQAATKSVSLCHFLDGEVVGSYAMPLEEPDSYLPMDGAACYSPSDCWFGGQTGVAPHKGAFHLHWNGSTVTAVYEPEAHAVSDMINFGGALLESVQIAESVQKQPAVLHRIGPEGAEPFEEVSTFVKAPKPPEEEPAPPARFVPHRLPEYGEGVLPDALQGFGLASDGSPLGAGATQLWAAANPLATPPPESKPASLTVLHDAGKTWTQVLGPGSGKSPLPEETMLAGASAEVEGKLERGTSGALAPEPGSESAWLSLRPSGGGDDAEVALLNADGTVTEAKSLPESGEAVGARGEAGPIACPAPHDCWLATAGGTDAVTGEQLVAGWLFHLGSGEPVAPDGDPLFDGEDPVISYRPPDAGVPVIYPDLPPEDDSLANQQVQPTPSLPPEQTAAPSVRKQAESLLQHVKSRFQRGRRELVVSFTLTARAHVQLVGRRRGKVVASTRMESLRAGAHQLSLELDPAHWPTKLQFKATPLEAPAASGGSSPGAGPDTVGT
jgi:hypothetical protein